jgi:hypothetical protein
VLCVVRVCWRCVCAGAAAGKLKVTIAHSHAVCLPMYSLGPMCYMLSWAVAGLVAGLPFCGGSVLVSVGGWARRMQCMIGKEQRVRSCCCHAEPTGLNGLQDVVPEAVYAWCALDHRARRPQRTVWSAAQLTQRVPPAWGVWRLLSTIDVWPFE